MRTCRIGNGRVVPVINPDVAVEVVQPNENGNQRESRYHVNLNARTCTCTNWHFNGIACCHAALTPFGSTGTMKMTILSEKYTLALFREPSKQCELIPVRYILQTRSIPLSIIHVLECFLRVIKGHRSRISMRSVFAWYKWRICTQLRLVLPFLYPIAVSL